MKLGPPEPFDINNPEHQDPSKYVLYQGNVLSHTLAVLRNTGSDNAVINLAALLHDVGKIDTHSLDENGKHRYLMHAKRSGEMIDDIAKRLKMTIKDKESLQFAAIHHMKMHDILNMSDSKILKLLNDDNWEVLERVALADSKARGDLFNQEDWDKIVAKVSDIRNRFSGAKAVAEIKKTISGRLVMDVMGITKGTPEVGRIYSELIDWIINTNIDVSDIDTIRNKIKELI